MKSNSYYYFPFTEVILLLLLLTVLVASIWLLHLAIGYALLIMLAGYIYLCHDANIIKIKENRFSVVHFNPFVSSCKTDIDSILKIESVFEYKPYTSPGAAGYYFRMRVMYDLDYVRNNSIRRTRFSLSNTRKARRLLELLNVKPAVQS